jgi:hypothetical protein
MIKDELSDIIKGLETIKEVNKTIESIIPIVMAVVVTGVILNIMAYTLSEFYVPKDVFMIKRGCEEFLYYKSPTEWIHIKNKF